MKKERKRERKKESTRKRKKARLLSNAVCNDCFACSLHCARALICLLLSLWERIECVNFEDSTCPEREMMSCFSFFSFQNLFSGLRHFSFFFLQVYGHLWNNRKGALTKGPILPARRGSLVSVIPNSIVATHPKRERIIIFCRETFFFSI